MISVTGLNQKVYTKESKMLHVRIELTTSGLWDRRSAYWANEAKFMAKEMSILSPGTVHSGWLSIVLETKSDDPPGGRYKDSGEDAVHSEDWTRDLLHPKQESYH